MNESDARRLLDLIAEYVEAREQDHQSVGYGGGDHRPFDTIAAEFAAALSRQ